jgi:hypothetical protein
MKESALQSAMAASSSFIGDSINLNSNLVLDFFLYRLSLSFFQVSEATDVHATIEIFWGNNVFCSFRAEL